MHPRSILAQEGTGHCRGARGRPAGFHPTHEHIERHLSIPRVLQYVARGKEHSAQKLQKRYVGVPRVVLHRGPWHLEGLGEAQTSPRLLTGAERQTRRKHSGPLLHTHGCQAMRPCSKLPISPLA